ncbi:unnamed protein product [Diatraea saccharalis]|uniref:HAT C-terminal dimerisation domain-containing protein n=1 Tax=Diatraea saccharalis TaxID=40085 RepID=A0A9N9RAL0_9NEOP|nr:unnamed protein product [Diatraea saccharalis]
MGRGGGVVLTSPCITMGEGRLKNAKKKHHVINGLMDGTLDQRFKKLAFRFDAPSYESAKDALKTELQNEFNCQQQPIEPTESTLAISTSNTDADMNSIWKDFDTLVTSASTSNTVVCSSIITMKQYLEERIIPRNECPLRWWQARAILYPELSSLADK